MLYGSPPLSVGMKADSQLFRTLTAMQDEVHRFAITFHRDKRSRRQRASILDSVPGIGEKTKETLLRRFGSVKRILEATQEQLQEFLGTKRGASLFENLRKGMPE